MPGPSGYDICRTIKESHRPVPVLLLRGAFEPFDERLAEACGADGFVTKPFEARRLVDRVRDLVERSARATSAPTAPWSAESDDEAEQALDELVAGEEAAPDAAYSGVGDAEPTAPGATPDLGRPLTARTDAVESVGSDEDGSSASTVVRPAGSSAEPAEQVSVRVVAEPAAVETTPTAQARSDTRLSEEEIDALAERVVRRLSDRVVREIAWEVVPELASAMIRQRLRELEGIDENDR
jgi:hypothetical protein